jgi:hypothetical protein
MGKRKRTSRWYYSRRATQVVGIVAKPYGLGTVYFKMPRSNSEVSFMTVFQQSFVSLKR